MSQKPRILIVEDEEAIRVGLVDVFIYHGFSVDSVAQGPAGLQKALTGTFDMILLDVMLPGMNGFDICNRIREQDKDQPIIMLTAKTSDEDIVHGLTLGADDYVAKPFSVAQLVLRVQAVLRRSRNSATGHDRIRLGDGIEIDILNLSGKRDDQPLSFTRREMDIIEYLFSHGDRPVSREELLNKVWGYAKNADIETRTVDIHIAKLRRKIEADSAQPRFLTTVRGAGYRLLVD
ncbi:MAG: DNA-binding response regulator [gamma proteobacterium symbiont of Ctena orbiculata]|nr:MAG: DNA-binding response regulator [gamma proteobacterium symbiont of Ctena orbiculata]PVV21202.1 MAG: DNA-binding response regulator [gamma proteobacterium symbiont of Ctena orbiculata]PVV22653.1 MAG: DNA-binding response regulator [gamma proteobacterium symbiont of Ctena orbiculata]